MISRTFSLYEFLRAMDGRSKDAIAAAAQQEAELADHAKSPAHRKQGSAVYAAHLGALIWLLEQGTRPLGVTPFVLQAFRPIVEALVRRGELGSDVLRMFEPDQRAKDTPS